MRSSWLENNQKSFRWLSSNIFNAAETPKKVNIIEEKYGSTWKGLNIVSGSQSFSRSPIDRERHGSISDRIIDPSLQEPLTPTSRKRFIHAPAQSVIEFPSCKKKYQASGKVMHRNNHSPFNSMVNEGIDEKYRRECITPDLPKQVVRKKKFDKGVFERQGNLLADKEQVKTKKVVKPDFVSHISGLPGTVKIEVPLPKTGDVERYRARLMLRTAQKKPKFGKQIVEGNGKWKSSLDFVKKVVDKKNNS